MLQYISKRLLSVLISLLGVSVIVFFMVRLTGDPVTAILGQHPSPEAETELRQKWGLDKPLPTQYLNLLWNLVRLDLGRSYRTYASVTNDIKEHFPATAELTIASMLFATFFGIAAGVIAATRRGTIFDYSSMFGSLVGVSMPIFWLAMTLIIIFAFWLSIVPISGRISSDIYPPLTTPTNFYIIDSIISGNFAAFFSTLWHLLLPAVTLGTVPLAIVARMTRSSLLEVMNADYVRTARAKGLAEKVVIMKHALKNSMIPVITVIGLEFGYLMGGAVMTETIFAWPGIGKWLYDALAARDMMQIQGGVLFIAVLFMLVNLTVDILYAYFDPRIRIGGSKT
ncbi:ABC transporter permease [Candidatus Poribacteria bacterium]|nr:ABC transporter permease [Candidatus Poribacteria bacterium]